MRILFLLSSVVRPVVPTSPSLNGMWRTLATLRTWRNLETGSTLAFSLNCVEGRHSRKVISSSRSQTLASPFREASCLELCLRGSGYVPCGVPVVSWFAHALRVRMSACHSKVESLGQVSVLRRGSRSSLDWKGCGSETERCRKPEAKTATRRPNPDPLRSPYSNSEVPHICQVAIFRRFAEALLSAGVPTHLLSHALVASSVSEWLLSCQYHQAKRRSINT